MTTEAPTTVAPATNPYSIEERMARIEANQEILIELMRDQSARMDAMDNKFDAKLDAMDKKFDAKLDAMDKKFDAKFDATNSRIDALNHRIFLAGLGLFTIVGAGVAAYIVNLLT